MFLSITSLRRIVAGLALCSALAGCGGSSSNAVTPVPAVVQAQTAPQIAVTGFSPALRQQMDRTVEDLRARMNVPGVMIRLTVPGLGEYSNVSGVSDLTSRTPINPRQHFRIGSVTKTFTVTALLQLADEGRLSLDDPISKYFLGYPRPAATLLELANMSSGLASYTYAPGFQTTLFSDTHRLWKPQELIDFAKADTLAGCAPETQACFEPGSSFYYCDTNTVMLGMVIEQVTGRSYESVLAQKILGPLGLSQTSVDSTGQLPLPYTRGYTPQGLDSGIQDATDWNASYAFAVGDIVSTMDDLAVWLPALGKGTLLKPSTQALRLVPNAFSVSPARFYAVGIASENGWLGHTGAVFGYNVFPYYDPKSGSTIVVVVNQDLTALDGKAVEPATVFARAIVDLAAREAPIPVILP